MQMPSTYPIFRRSPGTYKHIVTAAIIGVILVVTLTATSGPVLAAEQGDDEGVAIQALGDADEPDQREALSPELEANLDTFDRMEKAPGLYTHSSDTTQMATAAEIATNLDTFDHMEQAPGLFTKDPEEHTLTHPWGGDALTPDY